METRGPGLQRQQWATAPADSAAALEAEVSKPELLGQTGLLLVLARTA